MKKYMAIAAVASAIISGQAQAADLSESVKAVQYCVQSEEYLFQGTTDYEARRAFEKEHSDKLAMIGFPAVCLPVLRALPLDFDASKLSTLPNALQNDPRFAAFRENVLIVSRKCADRSGFA